MFWFFIVRFRFPSKENTIEVKVDQQTSFKLENWFQWKQLYSYSTNVKKWFQFFRKYFRRIFRFFLSRFFFPFSGNKTKITTDKIAKIELENWFQSNQLHPYATNDEIRILAIKTNMDEKKIKKWIENKRARSNMEENSRFRYFTKNETTILKNYYNTKTKQPNPEDLIILEKAIQKDKLKIRAWFNNQRFRENRK